MEDNRLNKAESALNLKACKNGRWVITNVNNNIQPVVTGCPNERRNGSAYCQECSEKFKKDNS